MAAAMMDSPYGSTTRCSNCHAELDLSNASSHICASNNDTHVHRSASSSIPAFPGPPQSLSTSRNAPLPGKLPKFAPPARIDPFAANEAFLAPMPTSADVRAASPFNDPARTGSAASGRFRAPPRSATTPHFRERSPSPKMRMTQDCAFPVFPTRRVREEQARKERQRSKSMSRSQSDDRGRQARNGTMSSSTSRSNSPALPQSPYPRGVQGPRKSSMSSQLSRGDQSPYINTEEPVPPLPAQIDRGPQASPKLERQPSPSAELPASSPLAAPPINAPVGDELAPLRRENSQLSDNVKRPSISAAIKPLDAIGSTRKMNQDLGLNIPRSQSAGGHRSDSRTGLTPPMPEAQSAVVESRQYPWSSGQPSSESPVLSRATLPDMPEHIEEEDEAAHHDVVGSLPPSKAFDQVRSTAPRTARESASSDGSAYSVAQSTSSRSSPPTSASSFTLQNDLPRGENIDSVLSDIANGTKPPSVPDLAAIPEAASISDLEFQTPATAPAPASDAEPTTTVPLQQRRRGPAKSFSRPNYARPQLELPTSTAQAPAARPPPRTQSSSSRSPRDEPMLRQDSRSPRGPPGQRSPGSDTRSPVSDLRSPPSAPMSPRLPHMPRPIRPNDPYANVPPSPAGSLRRPTTPGFKGNCRGCGEMIVGKSVSSADGRLTGRYHKHCFVCRTCKEPFQTADFYVMDNHPYCHRHYHTLNGSLCTVCDRGIEGPYMETDASKKFHPHCFTCKECHLILRHDYFEVDGAIYCEKHSKKSDLLGPGKRYPERRTTRLMMM